MLWTDILEEEFSDTLIAEFYKLFGRENTKKFMDVFGGMVFEVPRWAEINRVMKKREKEAKDDGQTQNSN